MTERASETAVLAGLARAALARDQRFPKPGTDDVVTKLLPGKARMLLWPGMRSLVEATMLRRMPGAYGFVYARSWVFDEQVREAVQAGATQVVVIGAGLDTRSVRLRGPTFFEVDQPATQAFKQQQLARAGLDVSGIRFVPFDANTGRLIDALTSHGFDRAARTVVIAEGFTFYVKPAAIYGMLGFVAGDCGPGSVLVFDYIDAATADGTTTDKEALKTRKAVAKRGEPFIFGVHFGSLAEHLGPMGLRVVQDMHAADLEKRYALPVVQWPQLHIGRFYGVCVAQR